jgi:hypothetical protein
MPLETYLLDDLLLLNQECPDNAILDHPVAEVASIDAVHCLGGPRQPFIAHFFWSEGLDLHDISNLHQLPAKMQQQARHNIWRICTRM